MQGTAKDLHGTDSETDDEWKRVDGLEAKVRNFFFKECSWDIIQNYWKSSKVGR